MKLRLVKKRFPSQSVVVSYPKLMEGKSMLFPAGSFTLTDVGQESPIDLPEQIAYETIAAYKGCLAPVEVKPKPAARSRPKPEEKNVSNG